MIDARLAITGSMNVEAKTSCLPESRPFIKMHGLGNHFVIVDARRDPFQPGPRQIRQLCDVRSGVGCDQLVVIEPPGSPGANVFMRLYNVDGQQAEACGNATRCVAWLLMEEAGSDQVVIETLAGLLACERAGTLRVACDMGEMSTDWQDVPLDRDRNTLDLDVGPPPFSSGVAVSVGNPHVVFFVEDIDDVDLAVVAPGIQASETFPEGVNVGIAQIAGDSAMKLRVYERGAGLTMACGSGACAAVYAARVSKRLEADAVDVQLPGGLLHIQLQGNRARMTGPVATAFRGTLGKLQDESLQGG